MAGIVLAAGEGSRFDDGFKLLQPWGSRTVVAASADAALEAGLDPVVVVVGHRGDEVRDALERRPVRVVENSDWSAGQASSLRRGVEEVRRHTGAAAAAVLLGDEPGISPGDVRAVVEAWKRGATAVARAVYRDRPGHPVVFGRSAFEALEALEGDEGARDRIAPAAGRTREVTVAGPAPADLDTVDAYREALPEAESSRARESSGAPGA